MAILKRTLAAAMLIAVQLPALAAAVPVKLYKNPNCGCCDVYADHLKENGFAVQMINTNDMATVKTKHGVPEHLEGCHTATIGKYVFEGLIPANQIKKVLAEKMPINGLSVPGMPVGAPGMPGNKKAPIHVYYLTPDSAPKIFASF